MRRDIRIVTALLLCAALAGCEGQQYVDFVKLPCTGQWVTRGVEARGDSVILKAVCEPKP